MNRCKQTAPGQVSGCICCNPGAAKSLSKSSADEAKRADKGGAREREDGRARRAGGRASRALGSQEKKKAVSRLLGRRRCHGPRRTGMVEFDVEALFEAAAAEAVDEADMVEVVMRADEDEADEDEADDEAADDDDEAAAADDDSVSPSEVMLNMFDWARIAVVLGLTKLIW